MHQNSDNLIILMTLLWALHTVSAGEDPTWTPWRLLQSLSPKALVLGSPGVWDSSSHPRGSPQKLSQLAIKKNSANWRVSFVQLNLGGLSVPGAPMGTCQYWEIPRMLSIPLCVWGSQWELIKVSSCSASRILQSGISESIIGRAHSLRSRYKYTFPVRRVGRGLTEWVKIKVRGRRITSLYIC